MRIVSDTNILLVSIPEKSKYRIIFDSLLSGKYTLVISNDIIYEYQEIIEQKANSTVANNIVEMILALENISKHDIYYRWNIIETDMDDNKFVDCAIVGNADYLVTNDKHFNIVKQTDFPPVNIINIDDFVEILST